MPIMTASARRVPEHTATDVNLAIAERAKRTVAWFDEHRDRIPDRLAALDREWDIERALATSSSGLSLIGLGLAASGPRRWLFLPLAVQAFYLQHTLQGWCPPLPVLRRLGFRTPAEIERERCALKDLLREDTDRLSPAAEPAPSPDAKPHGDPLGSAAERTRIE
jgi:hypothetical protein